MSAFAQIEEASRIVPPHEFDLPRSFDGIEGARLEAAVEAPDR